MPADSAPCCLPASRHLRRLPPPPPPLCPRLLQAETREHDLQQRLAVSQLEIRMLEAALAAKRRHVAEATHKLQAMRP